MFQAGLSWALIDRQWEKLTAAFGGFDPTAISKYRPADIARIGRTPGIAHSERKVKATIHNAQTLLQLDKQYGGFARYLRYFSSYEAASADIKERFAFVGNISVYYFLFRVGEKVPSFERWAKTVKGEHPRIREMVSTAKPARPRNERHGKARKKLAPRIRKGAG
ncbi:MAG: DNA-3-methyladenine glycosylase I [Candidatus Eremiobacteraeota bacterium]|nr:DNA-3-methyladenine glycosylase I [Candidatus Eremiobacteraeota bacterium]